jgi:hypothetical protein
VELARLTGPPADLGLKPSRLHMGYQALLAVVQGLFLNFDLLG